MMGYCVVSQELTAACKTLESQTRGSNGELGTKTAALWWKAKNNGVAYYHAPDWCGVLARNSGLRAVATRALSRPSVRASFSLKQEVAIPSTTQHPQPTEHYSHSSGHGLTWPVSSLSRFRPFLCTLPRPRRSWHFLHLWIRSPIPVYIDLRRRLYRSNRLRSTFSTFSSCRCTSPTPLLPSVRATSRQPTIRHSRLPSI